MDISTNGPRIAISVSLNWNQKLLVPLKDAQALIEILENIELLDSDNIKALKKDTINIQYISSTEYAELKLSNIINKE